MIIFQYNCDRRVGFSATRTVPTTFNCSKLGTFVVSKIVPPGNTASILDAGDTRYCNFNCSRSSDAKLMVTWTEP